MARLQALACIFALVLTACTGDGNAPGSNPTPSEVGEEGDAGISPEPNPSASSQVFAPTDDVLNVAISEPSTLDPMRIGDPGSVLVARQLYEGLTAWDPVEERVVPALAESWKASDGGRTFTFKLRPGMTFHDGSPITAADFRFAFDRIALKENASDVAYTLEHVAGFDDVNGLGRSRHLSGLTARDDLTLVIRLSEPYYDLPAVMTHPSLVPLKRRAVEDVDTFLSEPVGNGPFQIAQPWSPGQPVILRAFPGFVVTPELDGIRFLPYPDAAASWLQFVDGELHVAEVPAGQIEGAREEFGEGGFKSFLAGYYYGFNLDSPALDNRSLRIAISRAIDREDLASTIFNGTMQPPRGIVPTGMPGFSENICTNLCDHSPSAARAAIRKIPRKNREVTIEYTKGEPHDEVARAVKQDLESVGLRVRVKGFGFGAYVKRLRAGRQQLYRLGWIAEFPIPDVFLSSLFASDSPDNHSGVSSSRVDRLLDEAHAEASDNKRAQLYREVERAILREAPVAPIGSFMTHWAAAPSVVDITFDVMGGFDAAPISLTEEDDG